MSTQHSQDHKKLEVLAEQFSKWRQSRLSKNERIPKNLLDKALALAGPQPWQTAWLRTLRLNHTQLKRHEQTKAAIEPAAVEFVQLPVQLPSSKMIMTRTPTVQLTRQDGHKMTISDLNREQLSHVVSHFMSTSEQV